MSAFSAVPPAYRAHRIALLVALAGCLALAGWGVALVAEPAWAIITSMVESLRDTWRGK